MRGDINDPLTISRQLLSAFILLIIAYYSYSQFSTSLNAMGQTEAANVIDEVQTTFTWFDYLFPAIYVILSVFSLILASMVYTHIGFLPLTIFVSGFQLIMSWALTQVYNAVADMAIFSTTLANFPNTQVFFEYLGVLNAISIIIIIAVLYAKRPQQQTVGVGGRTF